MYASWGIIERAHWKSNIMMSYYNIHKGDGRGWSNFSSKVNTLITNQFLMYQMYFKDEK